MSTDAPTPLPADLEPVVPRLAAHLAQQRWYDGDGPPDEVHVVEHERWLEGDPTMWWLLVEVVHDGRARGRYQLVLGVRSEPSAHDFLHGKEAELVGEIETSSGSAVVYDATVDATLSLHLLGRISPHIEATSVRALNVEQSNTSIVYDNAVIVKLFRRIHTGPNPDVDAVARLVDTGFSHVPAQHGVLSRPAPDAPDDLEAIQHLAVARAFLNGATDGWHLALTSLRVLFADHLRAESSGGDFGYEARRLGVITAQMHLGMAEAYGTSTADLSAWVAHFRAQLDRVRDHVPAEAISSRYDAAASLTETGPAIRIHGDLHLGQTLRADVGWYVIDFEGEPARPLAERLAPSSPLRDVAGMLRSFHYAAEVTRWERGEDHADDPEITRLAADWERRARTEFLDAYLTTEGIDALLPSSEATDSLLQAFELDKATYEVAYEVAFRPTWVGIPLGAIRRLLA